MDQSDRTQYRLQYHLLLHNECTVKSRKGTKTCYLNLFPYTIHWVSDRLLLEATKQPTPQKSILTNHMNNGETGSPKRVPVTLSLSRHGCRCQGTWLISFSGIAFLCPPGTTQTGDLQHCRGQWSTPAISLPYVHTHTNTDTH